MGFLYTDVLFRPIAEYLSALTNQKFYQVRCVIIITRTARSEARIVRGTGYDVVYQVRCGITTTRTARSENLIVRGTGYDVGRLRTTSACS